MKRFVSALLVLCLLVGLTACGGPSEPSQEPVQEEKTTTTTAAPVEEKLTYADIVGGVRRIMAKELPTLGSVTDEQQNTQEDGSITKSFKYVDGELSVTVTLKEGEVVSVMVLCNTSKLPPVNNMQPITVASILMGIPASLIYSDGNVDKLISDFVANDPTSESDLGVTYVLTDENWKYVMNLSMLISTMAVVPLEQEETTTTADNGTAATTADNGTAATTTVNSATAAKPTASNQPTPTQNQPTPTQNQDPCANGHSWEDASCSSPATCSVCKKTSGKALDHEIDVAKCLNCDYADFSKIARTYSDISAYDLTTGETYDVQDVKISASGVFSFTFNGESYALSLVQKTHSCSYEPMVEFDCYRDGKKEVDAVVEVHATYYSPRLTWRGLQGCNLYIYAE